MPYQPPDWIHLPLAELSSMQWEQLCDGCGKCCMAKLQDEDTQQVYYTNVACELFDSTTCRCRDYEQRSRKVPDCVTLLLDRLTEFDWLPRTCAYRLRAQAKPLPEWHPLLTGQQNSVHEANISVRNKTVSAQQAGALEHHLVEWE